MQKFLLTAAVALIAASTSSAQNYISLANEGGFDVSKGKDYVVLYAPQEIIDAMGSKVISNNNLDPDGVENYLEYWVTDWDKKELTLYNVPEEGSKNSFGGEEYINATPLFAWGTGVFMDKTKGYDLSKVTDDHYIHIGIRDFGTSPSQYQLSIGAQATITSNGFQIQVGIDVGAADGNFVGIGKMAGGNDGKWYYIDMPIADLVDPDGNFGFEYDFSKVVSKDGIFAFTFKNPTVSKFTHSGPEPGEEVYSYEITQLGSALSIDHVFFYVPDNAGVDGIEVDEADAPAVFYDLSGRQVEDPTQTGFYIKKVGSKVTKVVVK